jgi:hypothetical protein
LADLDSREDHSAQVRDGKAGVTPGANQTADSNTTKEPPSLPEPVKAIDNSTNQPPGSPHPEPVKKVESVRTLDLSGASTPEPVQNIGSFKILDLSDKQPPGPPAPPQGTSKPYNPDETRETTRGDLARGLLWLLTFAIGGVLVFIGLGRLDGTVLTQSIFPSLVALAGTALGFYFGSQTVKESDSTGAGKNGGSATTGSAPSGNTGGGE